MLDKVDASLPKPGEHCVLAGSEKDFDFFLDDLAHRDIVEYLIDKIVPVLFAGVENG
jgi:hypothetical protein